MSREFEYQEDTYTYLKNKGIIKKMPSKCPYTYENCLYKWGDININYCSACQKFLKATNTSEHKRIIAESTLEGLDDEYLVLCNSNTFTI